MKKEESCYIAGPISFVDIKSKRDNLEMFLKCDEYLSSHFPNWKLLNPAKFEVQNTWHGNLDSDVRLILDEKPKHIVLLPHWQFSPGAKIEACVCSILMKSNIYLFEYSTHERCYHLVKLKNFKISYQFDFDNLYKMPLIR